MQELQVQRAEKGEKGMIDTRYFRVLLQAKRTDLLNAIGNRDEIAVENLADPLDNAMAQSARETAVSTINGHSKTLAMVNIALDRMNSGDYGVCLSCEEPISANRLTAVPWASLCLKCAERSELLEKQGGQD